MSKFKRKTDSVLDFLHNNYRPFKDMMVLTLLKSENALRVIKMNNGETFHLRGNEMPDYFFVIQGKVEVIKNDHTQTIDAIEDLGSLNVFPANYNLMQIKALTDSTIVQADSEMLIEMIAWDELARNSKVFKTPEEEASIAQIQNAKALRKLPFEAVEEIFKRLERVTVNTGEDIVTQGEQGDAFYIIVSGEAEVWQQGLYDDEQKIVCKLSNGDAFGEEALILKGTRNATIRMITDGVLFKLKQADFEELVSTPMINTVTAEVADTMLKNGHQLLDVRYEEEYDEAYISGSLLLPLPELRQRINELDLTQKYLVVCAAGKRASIGALLLKQYNVKDISVIDGGMRDWPYEIASNY